MARRFALVEVSHQATPFFLRDPAWQSRSARRWAPAATIELSLDEKGEWLNLVSTQLNRIHERENFAASSDLRFEFLRDRRAMFIAERRYRDLVLDGRGRRSAGESTHRTQNRVACRLHNEHSQGKL